MARTFHPIVSLSILQYVQKAYSLKWNFLQVSMLEKQFGFSSTQTGLLMSCNDIGYLCTVIFSGYIARKVRYQNDLNKTSIVCG